MIVANRTACPVLPALDRPRFGSIGQVNGWHPDRDPVAVVRSQKWRR